MCSAHEFLITPLSTLNEFDINFTEHPDEFIMNYYHEVLPAAGQVAPLVNNEKDHTICAKPEPVNDGDFERQVKKLSELPKFNATSYGEACNLLKDTRSKNNFIARKVISTKCNAFHRAQRNVEKASAAAESYIRIVEDHFDTWRSKAPMDLKTA